MFKDIFAGLAALEKGDALAADAPASKLAARIREFAFYDDGLFGGNPAPKDILKRVLTDEGARLRQQAQGRDQVPPLR